MRARGSFIDADRKKCVPSPVNPANSGSDRVKRCVMEPLDSSGRYGSVSGLAHALGTMIVNLRRVLHIVMRMSGIARECPGA